MFDIIGKRRWFYLISLAITIPGLIFILLTPLTGGKVGLQFSIDFTGGTVWEVHFANGTPASCRRPGDHGLHRACPARPPSPRSAASLRPHPNRTDRPGGVPAVAQPQCLRVTVRLRLPARRRFPPSASPAASTSASTAALSPAPSGSPAPSASASPGAAAQLRRPARRRQRHRRPGVQSTCPQTGKLADLRFALEDKFGPIDEVSQEANIGPIISDEIAQQALLLIVLGSIGILAWVTFRFQDFRMGATAIAALIHDVLVVVGTFAILARSSAYRWTHYS